MFSTTKALLNLGISATPQKKVETEQETTDRVEMMECKDER